MSEDFLSFISNLFPFKNIEFSVIEKIFSRLRCHTSQFSKGETVFSEENYQKTVGFIISGECVVESERTENEHISLNTLQRYASFGILSVFAPDSEYPTVIKATKKTAILFIDGEDLLSAVNEYPKIAMNVISFLASRISFLNSKIETFSSKTTADKLASYLLTKYKEVGNTIDIPKTKLTAEIGVGRASLYRDLDLLVGRGLIKVESKKITIICPEGLERI